MQNNDCQNTSSATDNINVCTSISPSFPAPAAAQSADLQQFASSVPSTAESQQVSACTVSPPVIQPPDADTAAAASTAAPAAPPSSASRRIIACTRMLGRPNNRTEICEILLPVCYSTSSPEGRALIEQIPRNLVQTRFPAGVSIDHIQAWMQRQMERFDELYCEMQSLEVSGSMLLSKILARLMVEDEADTSGQLTRSIAPAFPMQSADLNVALGTALAASSASREIRPAYPQGITTLSRPSSPSATGPARSTASTLQHSAPPAPSTRRALRPQRILSCRVPARRPVKRPGHLPLLYWNEPEPSHFVVDLPACIHRMSREGQALLEGHVRILVSRFSRDEDINVWEATRTWLSDFQETYPLLCLDPSQDQHYLRAVIDLVDFGNGRARHAERGRAIEAERLRRRSALRNHGRESDVRVSSRDRSSRSHNASAQSSQTTGLGAVLPRLAQYLLATAPEDAPAGMLQMLQNLATGQPHGTNMTEEEVNATMTEALELVIVDQYQGNPAPPELLNEVDVSGLPGYSIRDSPRNDRSRELEAEVQALRQEAAENDDYEERARRRDAARDEAGLARRQEGFLEGRDIERNLVLLIEVRDRDLRMVEMRIPNGGGPEIDPNSESDSESGSDEDPDQTPLIIAIIGDAAEQIPGGQLWGRDDFSDAAISNSSDDDGDVVGPRRSIWTVQELSDSAVEALRREGIEIPPPGFTVAFDDPDAWEILFRVLGPGPLDW